MTKFEMTFEDQCKLLKSGKKLQNEAFKAFLKDKLDYYKWSANRTKVSERKRILAIKILTIEQLLNSFERLFEKESA